MTFSVVEHFTSLNGEGPFSGALAFFIRFAGCNLCCSWCDTAWSQAPSPALIQHLDTTALTQLALASGARHITLTGGEPLLQPQLPELIDALLNLGLTVEIETNGSLSVEHLKARFANRDLHITMDYKLPGSGETAAMHRHHYQPLDAKDCIKCVISDSSDLAIALDFAKTISTSKSNPTLYFHAVFGTMPLEAVAEAIIAQRLTHVRLGVQLHKLSAIQ